MTTMASAGILMETERAASNRTFYSPPHDQDLDKAAFVVRLPRKTPNGSLRNNLDKSQRTSMDKASFANSGRFSRDGFGNSLRNTPNGYTRESPGVPQDTVHDDIQDTRAKPDTVLEDEEEEDTESESSGSGYDTDIDIQNDRQMKKKPKERDDIQAYMDACETLGTYTQTRILQQLSEDILNIKHRNIGPVATKTVAAALMHNIHIEQLIIEDNGIGDEGCTAICEMLLENDIIQYLNVADNQLKTHGAFTFGECMKYNKGITTLDLSSNYFADYDCEYIAGGLQINETLRELNLSHNGFAIRSGTAFGLAIAVNYTLRKLDLSWNHIREKGAVALCKGLQENCNLTHLNLSHNGMGYEGSLAIGNMLKANTVLQELDISHNRVTWRGAPLICKGLKVNETLRVLKIGWNPLSTTGCIDILEAVSGKTCAVSELDIQGVCVISEYDMLATAIAQNREFNYKHGGIVPTHDVLGERHEAKMTPMQRVINYMKKTGIRPTELFRTMDKQVNKQISKEEMIVRLKKNGIDMASYEVQELLDHLERNASATSDDGGTINYKNVSRTVQDQIVQDRIVKIKLRENEKRVKKYHKEILSKGVLPPITDVSEPGDFKYMTQSELNMSVGLRSSSRISIDSKEGHAHYRTPFSGGVRRSHSVGDRSYHGSRRTTLAQESPESRERFVHRTTSIASGVQLPAAPSLAPSAAGSNQKPKILSMSKPLGSKPAAFGSGAKKKKKKKKKKGKR